MLSIVWFSYSSGLIIVDLWFISLDVISISFFFPIYILFLIYIDFIDLLYLELDELCLDLYDKTAKDLNISSS
jgi:hypothetical protein